MSEDATEHDVEPTEATKREGGAERSARRRADTEHLERGTLIGRYITLEVLGEGGMGVVYSAFDPELDRKVAIKLLQGKSGGSQSGGDQAWLLREAQALARLAHPNVVSVHDVGSLTGDRVFVAMELVDGLTLRKWLKAEQRSWRDVLPVMRAAGQGLAAAHAAGLVHRDFKPDNVLVGNDGRVRVMDFGLARLRLDLETRPEPRSSDLHLDSRSPLSERLTMAGTVVGTPAYMAPELYDGEAADAASDQFSFGVTLFEALFGARPFHREDLVPPRTADPKPRLPETTRVPARVQRTVLRAISIDPAQRFPSMDALLAELAIDPNATKRRALIAGGAVALAAAGAAGVLVVSSRPEPCQGIEQRLAGVWDAAIKQKAREGFLATKRADAANSFARLERALDRYAAELTATSIDSCKATHVRRTQTAEAMSIRQSCLDQRLHELRALTTVLGDPSEALVDKGEKSAFELEPLANCSNVALLSPGQPPPELRAKVDELGKQLAEAKANIIVGRHFPALVASQKVLDGARAINYEPFIAEALLVRGAAYSVTSNPQEAGLAFIEGTHAALRVKRDDLVAAGALSAAMMVSDAFGKPGEGKVWLGLAQIFAKRTGLERALEQKLQTAAGVVAALSGDNAGAVAAHTKAFDAAVRTFGADSPALYSDEMLLATSLTKALAYERAVPHFEHALAMREKAVGANHLDIALNISNLGICYRHVGRLDDARKAFERSLAMREKMFGKANPILVAPLVNYADLLNEHGQSAAALPMVERAVKLAAQLPGVEHPSYHEAATTRAQVLGKLGRAAEARVLFDEIIAIETRVQSATLPVTQAARGELELDEKAFADAAAWSAKAIAGLEAAGGPENPELWRPLMRLGQAKLALGDRLAAKPLVERALAIGQKAGMGEYQLKPIRAVLAIIAQ